MTSAHDGWVSPDDYRIARFGGLVATRALRAGELVSTADVRPDPWHTHGPVTPAHLVALRDRDFDLAVSNVFRVLCDAATDAALSGGLPSLSLGEIRDRTLHAVDTVRDALEHLIVSRIGTHRVNRVLPSEGRYQVRASASGRLS